MSGDVAVLTALGLAVLIAAWGGRPAPRPPSEPPANKAPLASPPIPRPAVAVVPPEPEPSPTAEGCPEGCATPPSGCVVKGNVSLRTGERIYHVPGGEYYGKTVISPEKGERWFCTEEEAERNGWRRSKR